MNKHIEAAAAAIVECLRGSRDLTVEQAKEASWRIIEMVKAAYCESLASAGEDEVVEAMWRAYWGDDSPHEVATNDDMMEGMRAALAVARLSMGEQLAEWRLLKPISDAHELNDDLQRAEAKVARLREAVERAPHTALCGYVGRPGPSEFCNCWKAEALKEAS